MNFLTRESITTTFRWLEQNLKPLKVLGNDYDRPSAVLPHPSSAT